MAPPATPPTPLEQRVQRLERRARRLTALLALAGALAVAGFVRQAQDPDVLRARRFELVDGNGRTWALLWHDTTGTGLYLRDSTGRTRIGIGQFAHGGGGVALHGAEGRGDLVLYLKETGTLTRYDSTGVAARWP